MTLNEFLTVLDREIETLTADNYHASAAILREAGERLRATQTKLNQYENITKRLLQDQQWEGSDRNNKARFNYLITDLESIYKSSELS